MNYGTVKAADRVDHHSDKMTCFKFLFDSCCLRFRKKNRLSIGKSSGRRSSGATSECGDGSAVSVSSSSQVPNGGTGSSTTSRSRTHETYRILDEDEALISSSPREEVVSYGSQDGKMEKSLTPLITVQDCSEDAPENLVPDNCEKLSISKDDSNLEQVSVHSSRSQASLFRFEGDAEDGIVKAEDSTNGEKHSVETKDSDVDPLPAYQSQSQSASTERIGDQSIADIHSASADEEHFHSVKVSGDILFGLNYNYKTGVLEVHIKECRNLSPLDVKKNRSDAYVKGYLLPDRSKTGKKKTKVKKHSLNPVFDEVLKFPVTVSELERRTLWLSVWHSQFGRNDFLGEMMLPLGHGIIENYGYKRHSLKESLEKDNSLLKYNGDIILSLKFVPSDSSFENDKIPSEDAKGELHVLVKEAQNLIPTYSNGISNPFCKSYLLPEKTKTSKQKTSVVKKNCNPKWNHTFIYSDVSLSDLKERCLELTVWNHDKISSNNFLGGVRLNLGKGKHQGSDVEWMDSAGEEVNLWQAMLNKPASWNEGALLLRTQMQRSPNR